MNSLSPTQAAYAQMDAWSADYDSRLKRARAAHADRIRASDVLLGLAFAKFAGDEPLLCGRALRAALKPTKDGKYGEDEGPLALALLCETAIAVEAAEAVDVAPQIDMFSEAA